MSRGAVSLRVKYVFLTSKKLPSYMKTFLPFIRCSSEGPSIYRSWALPLQVRHVVP
jgi:hypothetical protein